MLRSVRLIPVGITPSVISKTSPQLSFAAIPTFQRRTAIADYKAPLDFDPVNMKFFCDGYESELMDDTRKIAMAAVTQHKLATSNRSIERETSILRERLRFMLNPPTRILSNRSDKSASSSDNFLISLAQYRTTPGKFYALYEACAAIDAQLAFSLSSHFTSSSCLASIYRPHISSITSGNVDTGLSIFTGAHQEVIAEDAPYQTVCSLDKTTGTLKLNSREAGGGKVVHALGSSARFAVLSVQYVNAAGAMKPQLLLLELRDSSGKLRNGISMKGLGGTGGAIDGLASCVMHLNEVSAPLDSLLTCDLTPAGEIQERIGSLDAAAAKLGEEQGPLAQNAMLNLATSQRLTNGALALGKAKRVVHDMVRYVASRKVQGPIGERDHPAMGVQTVQRQIAAAVVDVYVLNAAYRRVSKAFSNPGFASKLTTEDFVELAAISSEMVEMLERVSKTAMELCGWQSTMASAGFLEGIALASMWREGNHPEYVRYLYSRECVENSISLLKTVSSARQKILGGSRLSRFIGNPFFSPTSNDINRYLMLFGEKELECKTKLQDEMRAASRKGAEDAFYAWNQEQTRLVSSHSDAFLNVLCLRAMNETLQKSKDPYNSRVLNDIAWLWSCNRIQKDLDWYVQNNALKVRQVGHLHKIIDNLSNLLSHQAVHLVDCFSIPRTELDSPLPKDWETYWGPPKGSY